MTAIRRLSTTDPDFQGQLDALLAWDSVSDAQVQQTVDTIIKEVRARGDAALLDYTARFDGWSPAAAGDLEIPRARLAQAWEAIPADQRQALELAAARIRAYAEHQRLESWSYREPDGTLLGQQVTPLDRVGLYVPGGKAAYPSSVLMNAIPAKVAGVAELIMVVPTPAGEHNDLVLAAAHVAGVDRVFAIGGAQAVAALAYGTESIPPVDKIVGPGQHLRRHRQAGGLRSGGHRHGGRPLGDPGPVRRGHGPGLDRHGPLLPGRARRGRPVHPGELGRGLPRPGGRQHRPAAAHHGAAGDHRHGAAGARRPDPGPGPGRGHRRRQPRRPRAPGAVGGRPRAHRRAHPPRRGHLHGPLYRRGPGRLLRRAQPRAAHLAHRPLLLAAGGLRLPEALQPHHGLSRGRHGARQDRLRAGPRRGAHGPCAVGGVSGEEGPRAEGRGPSRGSPEGLGSQPSWLPVLAA